MATGIPKRQINREEPPFHREMTWADYQTLIAGMTEEELEADDTVYFIVDMDSTNQIYRDLIRQLEELNGGE